MDYLYFLCLYTAYGRSRSSRHICSRVIVHYQILLINGVRALRAALRLQKNIGLPNALKHFHFWPQTQKKWVRKCLHERVFLVGGTVTLRDHNFFTSKSFLAYPVHFEPQEAISCPSKRDWGVGAAWYRVMVQMPKMPLKPWIASFCAAPTPKHENLLFTKWAESWAQRLKTQLYRVLGYHRLKYLGMG